MAYNMDGDWAVSWGSSDNISIGADTFANVVMAVAAQVDACGIPLDAAYFAECKYDGNCRYCLVHIAAGSAIWHRGKHIWCGQHKTIPAPVGGTNENKDNDMAQMMEFRFPYTGAQIAAALEAQAGKIDARKKSVPTRVDKATAELLGYESNDDFAELIRVKQAKFADLNKLLEVRAARIRKEAVPFTHAGSVKFDLDLEDVEHYGLNEADATPPKPRKPRKARESAVVETVDA